MNALFGNGNSPNLGIPGFGGVGNTGAGAPGGPSRPPPPSDDDYEDEADEEEHVRVVGNFDPAALEAGAKALREIDESHNSQDVLRLVREQERTKQAEAKLRGAELEQHNLMRREQLLQSEYEQKRRLEQERAKQHKDLKEHEARLKGEHNQKKLENQRRTNEEWLQQQKRLFEEQQMLEKKTAQEIEGEKRRTLDYQAKLDRETAKIRADAESDGRTRQERANADVNEKLSRAKLQEDRKTRLEIRKEELAYYASFFSGLRDTLTSPEKMPWLVGGVSAMAFGIYGSRMAMSVTGRMIESRIGKPSLVRETSRLGWRDYTPYKIIQRMQTGTYKPENLLKNIVLSPSLSNRMDWIGRATRMTRENLAPFRHCLIYGPPGTGKTLFARSLAKNSGMHFAVVSGGDFAPLGSSAVTELHKLFDWAEGSNQGMILFIDEADAFLRKGRGEQAAMSENMRNALSAFLYRTGTETDKFMIVLATNVPEALDAAVLDRIDEAVEFPLPGEDERKKILQLYFKKYIKQEVLDGGKAKVIKTNFDENNPLFDRLSTATDGFSGRQLSKYMISVQSTMYAGTVPELDPVLMEQVLQTAKMSKGHGIEL